MVDSLYGHPGGAKVRTELPPGGKRGPCLLGPLLHFCLLFMAAEIESCEQTQKLFLKIHARCLAARSASLSGERTEHEDGEQVRTGKPGKPARGSSFLTAR